MSKHRHHPRHSRERYPLGGGYYIGGMSLCSAQFADAQTPEGDMTTTGAVDASAGGDMGAGDAGAGVGT